MDGPVENASSASGAALDQPTGDAECHRRLLAALLSTNDPTGALSAVCHEIAALVGCDRVQIWRGDIRQRTMHAAIAVGYDAIDAERIRALRLPMQNMPLTGDFIERKYLPVSHADVVSDFSRLLFLEYGIAAAAAVFLFGLVAGSFVNVVIHRFPRGESVVFPGSHCPACGAPIRAVDNVPVLSWLLLRGRCRTCRAAISVQYPLVELLTAVVFVAVVVLVRASR